MPTRRLSAGKYCKQYCKVVVNPNKPFICQTASVESRHKKISLPIWYPDQQRFLDKSYTIGNCLYLTLFSVTSKYGKVF